MAGDFPAGSVLANSLGPQNVRVSFSSRSAEPKEFQSFGLCYQFDVIR